MKTRGRGRSCSGKRRHATVAQALAHIERLGETLGAPVERYHPYSCRFCGGFHVGHRGGKSGRSR